MCREAFYMCKLTEPSNNPRRGPLIIIISDKHALEPRKKSFAQSRSY